MQRGYVFKKGNSWMGRWRQDQIVKDTNGQNQIVRRQRCEKLCEYGDRYRSKKDVRPLLDEKLAPLNEGRCAPESTLTVSSYVREYFLPYAERELKPSTVYGYKGIWRMYLEPRLEDVSMRDFRCVDATNVLAAIHRDHRLGRLSLRHVKAFLSVVFAHAKRSGVLDGQNPMVDAGIPRSAAAGRPTHAYTLEEVMAMLNVLTGTARTAVALMYFCGLRPGEARAARWENYDGKTLRIRESMWRNVTSTPKTADSVAPVPVAETLADVLAETRKESGLILSSPGQRLRGGTRGELSPVDLHNLAARVVVPVLTACAVCEVPRRNHGKRKLMHDRAKGHEFVQKPLPEWRGWYALRRGLATLATSLDSQMAAKSLLRHSNVATTQQYYIKSVPSEALRAVERMDALFHSKAARA